jgi:hypothetical protein
LGAVIVRHGAVAELGDEHRHWAREQRVRRECGRVVVGSVSGCNSEEWGGDALNRMGPSSRKVIHAKEKPK